MYDDDGPRPIFSQRAQFARELFETALLIAAVFTLVNLLSVRFVVEGSSMEPNFHDGQYIVVSRLDYMLDAPARGDVIVFHYPQDPSRDFIKRIVGLPGETVAVGAGQITINGKTIDEPYIKAPFRYAGRWTLADDEYFVLGDNRGNSNDSHDFGPIKRGVIVGRAWVSYWPVHLWGVVPHYDYSVDIHTP
ncbi:MAG: signal peptidase I [Anaerolineae bacterium]|nr:signal peptidase I [Anaerolineae bacterium]